jgi:hypothetical protein
LPFIFFELNQVDPENDIKYLAELTDGFTLSKLVRLASQNDGKMTMLNEKKSAFEFVRLYFHGVCV